MAKQKKVKKVKDKSKKKVRVGALFTTVVFIAISAVLLYSVVSEVLSTIKLTAELKGVNEKLVKIENENRDLQERKEKLSDPEYIKQYARGEYSLIKEGEQVFLLPPINKTEPEEETTE